MVEYLTALAIACVLGFLAGMGVGGGSLLMLWLTQIAGFPQHQARLTNLLFYLPAAIIATFFRKKDNTLRPNIILPGAFAGCAAAAVFSIAGKNLDTEIMKKLLGGLLIAIGLKEIFYRPRKAR